jgi:hypothetical protein
MSPAAPKLSIADQALANALGFLCAQVTEDSRTVQALQLIKRVLPRAGREGARTRALYEAGTEVLRCAAARNRPGGAVPWAQAMLTAHAAVADFLFWRASLAAEAFYDSEPKGETHAAE